MQKIHAALAPGGKLFIIYQSPFDIDLKAADPIIDSLKNNSFTVLDKHLKNLAPSTALSVISKPIK